MSDVLIINIFETSVGLNNGGSIPLLERVLETSLKMKIKEDMNAKTTLLVLIRDYKPKIIPMEAHKKTLIEIINNIWENIQKPKEKVNEVWRNYFHLVVHGVSDIVPEGKVEREKLSEVFRLFQDKNYENYLFAGKKGASKEFLMEELTTLIPNVWSDICLNKDLDILSQRESIALIRCDNLRKEILDTFVEKAKQMEE
jgi:hypothetical protein